MKVVLVMFTPEGERRDVPIKHHTVILGRDSSCDIRVPIGAVSRQHCQIEIGDDAVSVTDLGSRNGTYCNEHQITAPEVLHPGDRLAVGPIVFTVQIDGVPEPVEPPLLESPMVVTHPDTPTKPESKEEVRDAIVDNDDSADGLGDLLADLGGSSEFDFDLDDLEDSRGA